MLHEKQSWELLFGNDSIKQLFIEYGYQKLFYLVTLYD